MGNWWLAAISEQYIQSCSMSPVEYFGKTSNHPGDSALLHSRFGALWLLAFLKTKIIFESREILDHWWGSGKFNGAADGNLENCMSSQGAYFEGGWGIVLCTMFLVSCIISNKCICFSYYISGYILDNKLFIHIYYMLLYIIYNTCYISYIVNSAGESHLYFIPLQLLSM